MSVCSRSLSPLQRRSIQLFGANLALTATLTLAASEFYKQTHPAIVLVYLLAALLTIPVIGVIVVVGRYLRRESDEFIRMMVVQSLLWGLGVTFAMDTFLGGLFAFPEIYRLIPILNLDLFCVTCGFALRIQLWRNQ
jgi:hypothetical protein